MNNNLCKRISFPFYLLSVLSLHSGTKLESGKERGKPAQCWFEEICKKFWVQFASNGDGHPDYDLFFLLHKIMGIEIKGLKDINGYIDHNSTPIYSSQESDEFCLFLQYDDKQVVETICLTHASLFSENDIKKKPSTSHGHGSHGILRIRTRYMYNSPNPIKIYEGLSDDQNLRGKCSLIVPDNFHIPKEPYNQIRFKNESTFYNVYINELSATT